MKINKIITLITTIYLLLSCQTTYNSTDINWPDLSPIQWRTITTKDLIDFENSKINLFEENNNGESALFFASQYSKNSDVVEYLVNIGLEINKKSLDGNTPLIFGALNSNSKVVSILLDNGADIHSINNYGIDALGVAFLYGENSKNIINLLKEYKKITPELKKNITPFMTSLLSSNEDLNRISTARSLNGYTSAMFSLQFSSSLNTQKKVIINSKKMDARDSKKWSIGTLASIYTQYPEIIELLIKKDAIFNPNIENKISALMLAASVNTNTEVLQKVIDRFGEINKQSIDGFTPLMFACLGNKNHEVISLLLKNGADPFIVNKYNETALDLILKNPDLLGTNGYWELNDYIANNNPSAEK